MVWTGKSSELRIHCDQTHGTLPQVLEAEHTISLGHWTGVTLLWIQTGACIGNQQGSQDVWQKQTHLLSYWLIQDRYRLLAFPETLHMPGSKPFCCQGGWEIALVGSRFTHAAESRYAPIEGEALAVADALEKARFFVLGRSDLIVVVDHKPLLRVFTDRSLEAIGNPRIQNLKEKTLCYRFQMIHIPGARHNVPPSHWLILPTNPGTARWCVFCHRHQWPALSWIPDTLLSRRYQDCWWLPPPRLGVPHPGISYSSVELSSGSDLGSGAVGHSQWSGHEPACVHYRIWHAQSLSWTPYPTQRLPPIPQWSVHCWWSCHLQGACSHPPLSPWGSPRCSPCCTPGSIFNDGMCWGFCILARHHLRHHHPSGQVQPLQPHVTIPA